MNFDTAYEILGDVPKELIDEVNKHIGLTLSDADYNYKDRDVQSKEYSWLRKDFMAPPSEPELMPLYEAILAVINYIRDNFKIDPLNSVSVSMLKPKQVLAEHTDGRFLHRITNRYLVPLMDSKVNYMYGYVNGEKVQWNIEFGKVYRINNAIIHSAINNEDAERFNILIDTFDSRLKAKFNNHPDKMAALTVLGVNFESERRLMVRV